jgi:transcriptional regulator NrdR family protein
MDAPVAQRVDVIKSGDRRSEEFDPEKLHRSIVATCLSIRTPEGQAEEIARAVCLGVMQWCTSRPEITSSDIRRIGADILQTHHPEAAYLYRQQLTVL